MKTLRYVLVAATLVAAFVFAGLDAAPLAQSDPSKLSRFSTAKIDVDYQSANLRAILRTLADVGGVNLVLDPSISTTASVDLKLTGVPWDQVMAVILRSSGLTYQLEGDVLTVITRDAYTKELDEQARQKKASEAAPDLQTAQLRLNYASAEAVAKLITAAHLKSDRGTVEFIERTNTVMVKDVPQNLEQIQALVADMDRPEPQVEIEAKIVRTSSDMAKALGVKWGFNGRMSPELGNTTGLAFPNSGSVGGRVSGSQGPADARSSALEQTTTGVNLPAAGASTAFGLALGGINGAFGLDFELSALQRNGKATILSTPRVTTQNNKEAVIKQGFQVPVQMVTNNTITVQFKDAALVLTVTPQITAANTVIMRIALENNEPDFSRAVNGNPSINTQSATTQVQVGDGLTTVIGGILKSQETISNESTPGASSIPMLGRLFKRTDKRSESNELLIFITPRIIRG